MESKLITGAIVLAGLVLLASTPQVPGGISTRWFANNLYEGVIGCTQWAMVGRRRPRTSAMRASAQ